MWKLWITLFLVFVCFPLCSRPWLWHRSGHWLLLVSFFERIAVCKYVQACAHAFRSGFLRQFGTYRLLTATWMYWLLSTHIHTWRTFIIVTPEYAHSHVETFYNIISCVCAFSVLLVHLTVTLIRSVIGCWFPVFENGLQTVSVLRHARKLSD